jgi:DNA-binding response OmpR family regulator
MMAAQASNDAGRPDAAGASPVAAGASVLLVEDERSIAEPFARALRRNGFQPMIAGTAAEALRAGRERSPDMVLLDLSLPDGDGWDVCRELRRHSDVPIIMLTARGTISDRVVGLELGADDYVVKPFATTEVISRIRAILRRVRSPPGDSAQPPTPAPLEVADVRLDLAAWRVCLAGEELALTRKEFDLLARLARDAGRVVTRETLMAEVWDENWLGSTKTLDVHIAGLRPESSAQLRSRRCSRRRRRAPWARSASSTTTPASGLTGGDGCSRAAPLSRRRRVRDDGKGDRKVRLEREPHRPVARCSTVETKGDVRNGTAAERRGAGWHAVSHAREDLCDRR